MTRSGPRPRLRARVPLGAAALACALAGCTPSTPPLDDPLAGAAAVPDSFSAAGVLPAPARWWTALGDPALDAAVDTALAGNLDLKTAWQRLREARAAAGAAAGARWPQLQARLDAETVDPDQGREPLGLEFSAAYEVDLWGRVGARAEAARLRADASLADYRTAALTLSAETARAWFGLAEAGRQTGLLAAQEEANAKALTLLEARFGTGQAGYADILRQRQLLEATREQSALARARAAAARHRLAVLQGRAPTAPVDTAGAHLPAPPPPPATGLPADLVRRRPDVQRAHLLLRAADRDLAAAVADRYPRLTLTGAVASAGESPGDLFEGWIRSLAGSLLAPLFTGGELSAEVDRAEARRGQRLYEYAQTVLTAFAEVEDALAAERARRAQLASLERQVRDAAATERRVRTEYLNGVGSFLDVLIARVSRQQLERDLLAARLAVLESRIALHRALAGGFAAPAEDPS